MHLKKSNMELAIKALFELGDAYVDHGMSVRGAEYREAALRFRAAVDATRKNRQRRDGILVAHGAPR